MTALLVGRQPILTAEAETYGYELLFRNGTERAMREYNSVEKTSHVIDASFYELGVKQVTTGKKAFINFSAEMLVNDYWKAIPKDKAVIEVLETVEPNAEVVQAKL